MIAALGLTVLIIVISQELGIDNYLAEIEASNTSMLLNAVNIGSYVSNISLMIPTIDGWAVLVCTLECSALFELSVFFSLLVFYFRFSAIRKLLSIILGLSLTYIVNVLRLFVIALIAHKYGDEHIYLAHTVVGRLLFFGFVLLLYWYLVTRPTVSYIGRTIIEDAIESKTRGS